MNCECCTAIAIAVILRALTLEQRGNENAEAIILFLNCATPRLIRINYAMFPSIPLTPSPPQSSFPAPLMALEADITSCPLFDDFAAV